MQNNNDGTIRGGKEKSAAIDEKSQKSSLTCG